MLETIYIFEAANFVLWNALKLWLGPVLSYLWLYSVYVCEALGQCTIRKQPEPFRLFSVESLLPATKKHARI